MPSNDSPRPAMTPVQVQRALGLQCVASIYRMIDRGQLPAAKLGRIWRIRAEDVDALLAGRATEATEDTQLAEHIAKVLQGVPRLSDDQRAALADLLAPIRAGQGDGAA